MINPWTGCLGHCGWEVLRSETEGVGCWARIGRELCWSAEWGEARWVVVAMGATVQTGAGKQLESPWCRGSLWSSGEFWGLWELEGRRTLGLSRPKIWRGGWPPKLCRPGMVKWRLESPCSLPWRTRPLGRSLRQRTDWVRFLEEASILSGLDCWVQTVHWRLHSWLLVGESEWEEFRIGPENERVPEFCWTGIWNGSLPVCGCRPLRYCCRSTREQSD